MDPLITPAGTGCAAGARMHGLTLAELLVTLAVAAVLATLAGPAFGSLVLDTRLASSSLQLAQAINHGRAEALRRGQPVTLCGRDSGCGNWQGGWQLRLQAGASTPPDTAAVLQLGALSAGLTLTANRSSFTLRPFGQRATNGTLLLCDRRGRGRAIIVSVTGRARIAPPAATQPCPT